VTAVKVKGQWTRQILDEEQLSTCFPGMVKALRVSSEQNNIAKINGIRSTVKTNFWQKSMIKVEIYLD